MNKITYKDEYLHLAQTWQIELLTQPYIEWRKGPSRKAKPNKYVSWLYLELFFSDFFAQDLKPKEKF